MTICPRCGVCGDLPYHIRKLFVKHFFVPGTFFFMYAFFKVALKKRGRRRHANPGNLPHNPSLAPKRWPLRSIFQYNHGFRRSKPLLSPPPLFIVFFPSTYVPRACCWEGGAENNWGGRVVQVLGVPPNCLQATSYVPLLSPSRCNRVFFVASPPPRSPPAILREIRGGHRRSKRKEISEDRWFLCIM